MIVLALISLDKLIKSWYSIVGLKAGSRFRPPGFNPGSATLLCWVSSHTEALFVSVSGTSEKRTVLYSLESYPGLLFSPRNSCK